MGHAKRLVELTGGTGKSQTNFAYNSGRDKQTYNKNEKGKEVTIYTITNSAWKEKLQLLNFSTRLFVSNKKGLKK